MVKIKFPEVDMFNMSYEILNVLIDKLEVAYITIGLIFRE
jgi:hypothetical protein